MSILDRFKSKKEQDVKNAGPAHAVATETSAVVPAKIAKPKAEKTEKKEQTAAKAGKLPADLLHILVKPLVTEKSAILASHNQYAFRVAMEANRVQVKQAVKALYGVSPLSINIQRVRGKVVRFGKTSGQRQTWKKAIVTLPKGTSIDVYAGV